MSRTRKMIMGTVASALAAAALAPSALAAESGGFNERTATELGQAVGEPEYGSAATALYSRTPTELGQSVPPPATQTVQSSGFDWGDAAIGAGAVVALALVALAGVAMTRRRLDVGLP
jgi:nitroreductase